MDGDAADEDVDQKNDGGDEQQHGPEILAADRFGQRAAKRIDRGDEPIDGPLRQLALNDLAGLTAGRLGAGQRREQRLVRLALAEFGRVRNADARQERRRHWSGPC